MGVSAGRRCGGGALEKSDGTGAFEKLHPLVASGPTAALLPGEGGGASASW